MSRAIRRLCWIETKSEEGMEEFMDRADFVNDIDEAPVRIRPVSLDIWADVASVRQYLGNSFVDVEDVPEDTVFHFGKLP